MQLKEGKSFVANNPSTKKHCNRLFSSKSNTSTGNESNKPGSYEVNVNVIITGRKKGTKYNKEEELPSPNQLLQRTLAPMLVMMILKPSS